MFPEMLSPRVKKKKNPFVLHDRPVLHQKVGGRNSQPRKATYFYLVHNVHDPYSYGSVGAGKTIKAEHGCNSTCVAAMAMGWGGRQHTVKSTEITQIVKRASTTFMRWVLHDVQRTASETGTQTDKLVDGSNAPGLGESRWSAGTSHYLALITVPHELGTQQMFAMQC